METRKELINEYKKWTASYVEANNRLNNLLPSEELKINKELLAKFDRAWKEVENAQDKRREILKKLYELPTSK